MGAGVSVVIATYDGAATLGETLTALVPQVAEIGGEVLLADNRARFDLAGVAAPWIETSVVSIVAAGGVQGQAHARNVGARAAKSQAVLFMDEDDVPAAGYVEAMLAALESSPIVGARIDVDRLNPGWRARVRDMPQRDQLPVGPPPWTYGTAMGVRRDVFEMVGGFREDLGAAAAGEDVEFCVRAAALGFHTAFVPDAVLHYRFRTGYRDLWRQGLKYGRGGIAVGTAPRYTSSARWLRSLAGPATLLLRIDPALRRRAVFLLGRRVAQRP